MHRAVKTRLTKYNTANNTANQNKHIIHSTTGMLILGLGLGLKAKFFGLGNWDSLALALALALNAMALE